MPVDVRHALVGYGVMAAYKARPTYQQNDYLLWVNRARLEATRAERVAQMVIELKRGDRFMKAVWRPVQSDSRSA